MAVFPSPEESGVGRYADTVYLYDQEPRPLLLDAKGHPIARPPAQVFGFDLRSKRAT